MFFFFTYTNWNAKSKVQNKRNFESFQTTTKKCLCETTTSLAPRKKPKRKRVKKKLKLVNKPRHGSRGPKSLQAKSELFACAGTRTQIQHEKNNLREPSTMHVIRWGFKLAWKGAPREMRRYGVGEVGSFDPRNAHAGVCWGWPKECSLTDTQAKTIMLKCYRSRNFTYPMLCAIRKSMSYAWELRGGVKSKFQKNFKGVNSVWNAVKESECPGITMSQIPELIPTPEN